MPFTLLIALFVHLRGTQSTIFDVSDFTFYVSTFQYTLRPSTSPVLIHHDDLHTNITINTSSLIAFLYQADNPNVLELRFSDDQEWDDVYSVLQRMPMIPDTSALHSSMPAARDRHSRTLLQYDDSLEDHGSVLYPHSSPMHSHMAQDMMHNPQMMQMMMQMMQKMKSNPNANNNMAPAQNNNNNDNNNKNDKDNNKDACHSKYGCKKCSGNCNPCGESPCEKKRRRDRRRRHWRRSAQRKRVRRQKRRERWRERLRKLRHHNDRKLERELEALKIKHAKEGRTYAWIADLLHRKVMGMKQSGQIPPFGFDRRRRRRRMLQQQQQQQETHLQLLRCRVIKLKRNFEFCMADEREDGGNVEVTIKFVNRAVRKENRVDEHNYRAIVNETQTYFDSEYHDKVHANPIYRNLAHMLNRYEAMNWHSFPTITTAATAEAAMAEDTVTPPPQQQKHPYGEFVSMNEYKHYFDAFEFLYHVRDVSNAKGEEAQCSAQLPDLPFKLCVVQQQQHDKEFVLYFEKDTSDAYSATESYSFVMKQFIDEKFEHSRFRFGSDEDWDEIEVVENAQDMDNAVKVERKCSYRLMTAKVCMEMHMDDGNHDYIKTFFSFVL